MSLSAINYQADIEIAKNVYQVDVNGAITTSPVKGYSKFWSRDGIEYAKMVVSPPDSYSGTELLNKKKQCPFSIEEMTSNINTTCNDKGVSGIIEELNKS